jgi:oligopeptide transport system permease protein
MPDMNRNVANPAGEDDLLATRHPAPRPGQDHFIADTDETGLGAVDAVADESAPSSMWGEAWRHLRRRPLFWVSALLILVAVLMAVVPQLFTSVDPRACTLSNSLGGPQAGHPFGFDRQGCDIYSRTIYGARASVSVGLLTTALVVVIGTFIGAIAGYFGGILDTLLSRVTDIFFAIPLVLAAIVVMQMFKDHRTIITVVLVLGLFGWTNIARITRGAVMGVKNEEYVTAARALGASRFKILASHIMPNAAAPIIVYATVALGTFIVAEATLSFLGIGLPPSIVSWGGDISAAQASLRTAPMVLFYPAMALALTVLSFIMLGDVVRDALDPKARKR